MAASSTRTRSFSPSTGFVEPHLHNLTKLDRAQILRAFDEVRLWQWRNEKAHGQAVS